MTQVVNLVHMTPDAEDMILRIARVSSAKPDSKDPRLLRYLIRNHHWSPFEMASMCLEIFTSRAIAQQILRHRSFSFQEFSQRYSAVTSPFLLTKARVKGASSRQCSLATDDMDLVRWWEEQQAVAFLEADKVYHAALTKGIAPEVARMVLPLATPTHLYMHGTLRSWIHYIHIRDEEHAQAEHIEVAQLCKRIFVQQLPIIAEALEWTVD